LVKSYWKGRCLQVMENHEEKTKLIKLLSLSAYSNEIFAETIFTCQLKDRASTKNPNKFLAIPNVPENCQRAER
jgi:hypothetical protein